jgi:membrane protease subunit HflK
MIKIIFKFIISVLLFLGASSFVYVHIDDLKTKGPEYVKSFKKNAIRISIVLLIIFLISTSFYIVDQTEYALISTLGVPNSDLVLPGPHLKLPYPIQSLDKLSKEVFSLTFGYHVDKDEVIPNNEEAKMITGDENIILADLEVQWKIVDPIAYLHNTVNPEEVLFNATSASLRNVIGTSTIDNVLTDGRVEIRDKVKDNLTEIINSYNLGISIENVNLQDIDLPTEEVDAAFKAVTSAREARLTRINNAEQYKNTKMNELESEVVSIISKAESTKVTYIEQAKGDVARFNALYSEYVNNKEVTEQRIIINAMDLVFKNVKLYITDDSSGTVKYLPIDALSKEAK